MTLHEQAKQILNNFDNFPSEKIIEILTLIQPHLKTDLTQNYLAGKIQAINSATTESEKRKLCKNLKPYLDWYLQGT